MIKYDEICGILKQKTPFVFVDRVLDMELGKRITAIKCISGGELFSALHFPKNSVYPGIFMIECIAQTASILCTLSGEQSEMAEGEFLALGGIQRLQFMQPVRPGDTIRIEDEIIKQAQKLCLVKAQILVDMQIAAEGQLSFGVVKDG